MYITETAFYILGVSPDIDRNSLLELTENLSLTKDEEIIRSAYRSISLSSKRLAHEIAWVVDAPNIRQTLKFVEDAKTGDLDIPAVLIYLESAPLSLCNLLIEYIKSAVNDKKVDLSMLPEVFEVFSRSYERISSNAIAEIIDSFRKLGNYPTIKDINDVKEALLDQKSTYIATFRELVKVIPISQYVKTLTRVVEKTTDKGKTQNSFFLIDLIAAYQIDVYERMSNKVSAIKGTIAEILAFLKKASLISSASEDIKSCLASLKKQLISWDALAQPIQISYMSQGKEHEESIDLANIVRELALNAYNEFERPDISIEICDLLGQVFEEVPTIKEQINKDKKFLSGLIVNLDKVAKETLETCLAIKRKNLPPEQALYEIEKCTLMAKEALLKTNNPDVLKNVLVDTYLEIAIVLSNDKQAYLASLAIINEALEFVCDKEKQKRLNENRVIIQGNLFNSIFDSL